jgi:hypothetical protein
MISCVFQVKKKQTKGKSRYGRGRQASCKAHTHAEANLVRGKTLETGAPHAAVPAIHRKSWASCRGQWPHCISDAGCSCCCTCTVKQASRHCQVVPVMTLFNPAVKRHAARHCNCCKQRHWRIGRAQSNQQAIRDANYIGVLVISTEPIS